MHIYLIAIVACESRVASRVQWRQCFQDGCMPLGNMNAHNGFETNTETYILTVNFGMSLFTLMLVNARGAASPLPLHLPPGNHAVDLRTVRCDDTIHYADETNS